MSSAEGAACGGWEGRGVAGRSWKGADGCREATSFLDSERKPRVGRRTPQVGCRGLRAVEGIDPVSPAGPPGRPLPGPLP